MSSARSVERGEGGLLSVYTLRVRPSSGRLSVIQSFFRLTLTCGASLGVLRSQFPLSELLAELGLALRIYANDFYLRRRLGVSFTAF